MFLPNNVTETGYIIVSARVKGLHFGRQFNLLSPRDLPATSGRPAPSHFSQRVGVGPKLWVLHRRHGRAPPRRGPVSKPQAPPPLRWKASQGPSTPATVPVFPESPWPMGKPLQRHCTALCAGSGKYECPYQHGIPAPIRKIGHRPVPCHRDTMDLPDHRRRTIQGRVTDTRGRLPSTFHETCWLGGQAHEHWPSVGQ